ncbi:DUF2332 domain-containing protein [Streptacidiphilus sp. PB12-B1b]|uniref:DUF2332 domain-containing protein n=1 Tax=Streptacidiphilus sp. PB12-B1b TaxID=2705012 RepID=UPI0015FBD04E|nr:DUF2332 domain-containing protein [Streptacidiphilus sp. PB12-B1b]QMU75541.1 DUF2332 domain-containing protein [Streptacidiphilus sp. PB12-B1b]
MPNTITDSVRRAFADPDGFTTSPLYRELARTVVAEPGLLELASRGRPGQYPTFLLFGAVHQLLLAGAEHPLARFYPSVSGAAAVADCSGAGAALLDFCARHEAELTAIIGTRLVQTNHVQRALGLRLGLCEIAAEVGGPVHLVEVGTSAGLNLRFDRYGYRVGGRQYGDPASPVQLVADVHGGGALPDLDALPALASTTGVDLDPVDVRDPDHRRWLEALVWPENHDQRALLAAALELVAADPPTVLAGDAVDVLPELAGAIPAGEPRVVFHSATRMHVPADRRDAFDAAVAALGDDGPLWWLSVEDAPDPDPRPEPRRPGVALHLRAPDGRHRTLAVVEGHLRWLEPLPDPA